MAISKHADRLSQLGFEQITGRTPIPGRTPDERTPYFVRGTGLVPVTFAFDEWGYMWVVSKQVALSDLGFVEKNEDVVVLLRALNELTDKRREELGKVKALTPYSGRLRHRTN